MKKTVSVLLACILIFSISVMAMAESGGTVTEEVNEQGNLVKTFTDENGNTFSVEELPEFTDDEPIIVEAPTDDPTTRSTQGGSNKAEGTETQKASGPSALVFIIPIVVVIAGAAVFFLLRRKK